LAPEEHLSQQAAALVVAAGTAKRMNGVDKIFANVHGNPLLSYALALFERSSSISRVVVVVRPDQIAATENLVQRRDWCKVENVVPGGERRQDSVAAGLAVLPDEAYVVVHDGARPFASRDLLDRCCRAAWATGASVPAIPLTDTIKRVKSAAVVETVDRAQLWAAQTPQVFSREVLDNCLRFAQMHDLSVTDECSIAEMLGVKVAVVQGERWNVKITTPEDLDLAEWIVQRHVSLQL
jgi:2-C-methyl-D-erythritol 4-phosphate cytidylyltransferase